MPILHRPALPEPARVIVLNGASSSGKTTLAKAMQALWASPLHHVQLDSFRSMEPPRYWDGWETREKEATELMMDALCGAMYATVAEFSRHGQEVVFDTALTNPRARHLLVEDLENLPVYLVAVHCESAELAKREAERKNRELGLAGSQVDWLHKRMQYDFEIDTTEKTPEKAAAEISLWLAGNPTPSALCRLRAQLNEA